MRYRRLGKTGLNVSEIGFGCGNIGGLMVRGTFEEQVTAVSRALDLGVNYFDTAPAYGNGKSETNLGKVLAYLDPELFLASKVGISPDDLNDLQGVVVASLERSLERLGRESVDVLQLHTPIVETRARETGKWGLTVAEVLGVGGIADAFESVRSRGLTRFLGITGLGDTGALNETINSRRFDTVQAYYNILNPSAGQAMPPGYAGQDFNQIINRAADLDMGVIVIRVMAGGALGGPSARTGYASPAVGGALVPGSDYQYDERRARELDSLGLDNMSLPQVAIRFALMQQNVSTVLVGFSDTGQVDEAVSAAEAGSLPGEFIERLEKFWSEDTPDC